MAIDSADNKVHLAVFGKHPGWDDHIEEIGLDVPELVTARRLLYSEGVAGNIDSGAWDRLEEGKLLPAFNHNFFWRIGGQWIVGRMWSSRDGKGRAKYPMIICGRIDGASASFAARSIVPALMRFEETVKATTIADDVKQAASTARAELVRAASGARASEGGDADLLRRLVDHPNLNPGGDPTVAFERVMYEIEREMQGFRRQSAISRAKQEPSGQHIRVPRCFDEAGESAQAWTALLDRNIDASTAVLVIEPDDADFVDVLVGAPAVGHIFCLRANRQGLGLSTDVPYTIDPDFSALVRAKRESYRKNARTAEPNRPRQVDGEQAPSKVKWFVIAGVGLVGIIGAVVALSGGGESTTEKPPISKPDSESRTQKPAQSADKPIVPKPVAPEPVVPEVVKQPEADPKVQSPPVDPAPQAKPITTAPERKPDAPRTFDPADPRASWGAPKRLAELNSRQQALAQVHAADAPREASTVRDLLRDAQDILKDAMEIEYPQGRITLEFTMKKLDERLAEIEKAAQALDQRVIASAKSAAITPKLSNAALADAWRTWFASIDFSRGSVAVRATATEAQRIFERIDGELARAPGAHSVASGFDLEPLRAQVGSSAAESAAKGDFESALRHSSEFVTRAEAVESLAGKASTLVSLLDAGVLPGESSNDGATIESLVAEIRGSESSAIARGAFDAALARADELIAIGGLVDADTLFQLAGKGGAPSLVSMLRLGVLNTRIDATQLNLAAHAYAGPVAEALASIGDATRRAAVATRVGEAAKRVWLRSSLALGADDAGLDALENTAAAFGDEVWNSASAQVRFNRSLRVLRACNDSKAGDAAAEVLARADGLSPERRAALNASLDALRALKPVRKMLDFSQVGPATAGWKVVESDESRVVYEKGSRGGAPVRLEFRAVTTSSGGKSMVLTTEVSVRMAAVMAQDAKALTSKVQALVGWRFSGEGTDSRVGPRTWTWTGPETSPELAPVNSNGIGQGWLRGAENWITAALPRTNPKPNWDSPMQYIGLPGALVFARAAGCGLPTAEEFALASTVDANAGSNLRDASWATVTSAWSAANPGGTVVCPVSADSFSAPSATVVRNDSDGVVWFDRVDSGSGAFRNLIGNVAEYVVDNSDAMRILAEKPVDLLSREREAPVRICGASALSGPESNAAEGVRLTPLSVRGYSDVGFRLAFGLGAAEGPIEWDAQAVKRVSGTIFYVETKE